MMVPPSRHEEEHIRTGELEEGVRLSTKLWTAQAEKGDGVKQKGVGACWRPLLDSFPRIYPGLLPLAVSV